jgi:hypothetical protein
VFGMDAADRLIVARMESGRPSPETSPKFIMRSFPIGV